MEHPLINDASSLSLDDLQTRITDLTKKLSWAQRHNQHVAAQISMAIESYRAAYQLKMDELARDQRSNGTDYSDRIDIS
jgi:hypothetical protein